MASMCPPCRRDCGIKASISFQAPPPISLSALEAQWFRPDSLSSCLHGFGLSVLWLPLAWQSPVPWSSRVAPGPSFWRHPRPAGSVFWAVGTALGYCRVPSRLAPSPLSWQTSRSPSVAPESILCSAEAKSPSPSTLLPSPRQLPSASEGLLRPAPTPLPLSQLHPTTDDFVRGSAPSSFLADGFVPARPRAPSVAPPSPSSSLLPSSPSTASGRSRAPPRPGTALVSSLLADDTPRPRTATSSRAPLGLLPSASCGLQLPSSLRPSTAPNSRAPLGRLRLPCVEAPSTDSLSPCFGCVVKTVESPSASASDLSPRPALLRPRTASVSSKPAPLGLGLLPLGLVRPPTPDRCLTLPRPRSQPSWPRLAPPGLGQPPRPQLRTALAASMGQLQHVVSTCMGVGPFSSSSMQPPPSSTSPPSLSLSLLRPRSHTDSTLRAPSASDCPLGLRLGCEQCHASVL